MKSEFISLKIENHDGVVAIFMNNPPVNQLSKHFVMELVEAISSCFEDPSVNAIVLTGTGKNFIAGADLPRFIGLRKKKLCYKR